MSAEFAGRHERSRGRGAVVVTVIYVDTLFLLNAVIDYLLLLSAARLSGEPLRRTAAADSR